MHPLLIFHFGPGYDLSLPRTPPRRVCAHLSQPCGFGWLVGCGWVTSVNMFDVCVLLRIYVACIPGRSGGYGCAAEARGAERA